MFFSYVWRSGISQSKSNLVEGSFPLGLLVTINDTFGYEIIRN